ncbi:DUF523 domain-containing protein [Gorillibacterium sp. CAU 1737]|uniref:DUF523 domain-containing protein n=1 Tax=Gorillibacterium sp. CAU 1737 TaxID=3140362 RepID=UPI00326049AC
MILVSACLAGMKVRYDGRDNLVETLGRFIEEGRALPVCPEVLGGLSTPREPAEIVGGTGEDVLDGHARIIDRTGCDVTTEFVSGAYEALRVAREAKATVVVLKESSPSCGSSRIYDGTHSGHKIPGMGVTAALLQREGIRVFSENQLDELFREFE